MSKEKLRYIANEIISLLTNKKFILNILGIILFLAIVLFAVFTWLGIYTNHGQKLELPDYVNQPVSESAEDAASRLFEIIVEDSVHIVGKKGGIIQIQNPPGGSLVKENRKIYVTITKHTADKVKLSDMRFFGEEYDQIVAQLKSRNIYTKVKEERFDHLTQNSVLEVWHKGKMVINRKKSAKDLIIDKGDTLEFVISSSQGGSSKVLSLVGQTVATASFELQPRGLELDIDYDGQVIEDKGSSIIISQDPAPGTLLPRGSTISVKVKAP